MAEPIHVAAEEELPAIIERLRASASEEVQLVLPPRSRLGLSRFNFQLLRQYATRLGKRVAIATPDAAVQRMAEENGFAVLRPAGPPPAAPSPTWAAGPQPGRPPQRPRASVPGVPVAAGAGAAAAAPLSGAQSVAGGLQSAMASRLGTLGRIARQPAQQIPRIRIGAPQRIPLKLAAQYEPARYVLYGAAALLLIVGIILTVMFVPSADVTLVAQAAPFSTNVDFGSAPNKGPVKIRSVQLSEKADLGGVPATGQKVTPGNLAAGTFTYVNACQFPLQVLSGQRLRSASGVLFAQVSGDTVVDRGQAQPVQIKAVAPGQNGNIQAGQITGIEQNIYPCLTGTNTSDTAGGTDDQKDQVVQSSDVIGARTALDTTLRQRIIDELKKGAQKGETLAEPVMFGATPQFDTTVPVDQKASTFSASLTLTAEGNFYNTDDLNKAFSDALKKKVPANQQLTTNKVGVQLPPEGPAQTQGGHLEFAGTATGFVAPKIDLDHLSGQLAGRTTGQANTQLKKLPIRSVDIHQGPIPLPFMPFSSSRIHVAYDEVEAPPGPGQTSG
jgi:hypothetical protein